VVGNGFLHGDGSLQSLLSVLTSNSGLSKRNATGINDVGQGTFDGPLDAFERTPYARQVPEPAFVVDWCLASLYVGSNLIASRAARAKFPVD
jgi:hypothetical protein